MIHLDQRGFTFMLMYLRAQANLPDEEWQQGGILYGLATHELMHKYATQIDSQILPKLPNLVRSIGVKPRPAYCMNCQESMSVASDVPQIFQTCVLCTGSYNTHEILTDLMRVNHILWEAHKDDG